MECGTVDPGILKDAACDRAQLKLCSNPLDLKSLLASLASTTKAAQSLLLGEDCSFESSFPDFHKSGRSIVSQSIVSSVQKILCDTTNATLLGNPADLWIVTPCLG